MTFTFQPDEWVNTDIIPIKLHLSCDNYVGEYLGEDMKLSKIANEIENERLRKEKEEEEEAILRAAEAKTEDYPKDKPSIDIHIGDKEVMEYSKAKVLKLDQ